jgi:hypothetical protein
MSFSLQLLNCLQKLSKCLFRNSNLRKTKFWVHSRWLKYNDVAGYMTVRSSNAILNLKTWSHRHCSYHHTLFLMLHLLHTLYLQTKHRTTSAFLLSVNLVTALFLPCSIYIVTCSSHVTISASRFPSAHTSSVQICVVWESLNHVTTSEQSTPSVIEVIPPSESYFQ